MKRFQAIVALATSFVLMCFSAGLRAEDIDIYVSNDATVGVPNVLFVIDNAADFSSNDPNMNCTFPDGTVPTMQNTAGGVEQCGLIAVLNGLKVSSVNIGIMMGNTNGFATDTRAATDAAYHEVCTGSYGGCLLRKLTLMDAAGKASMTSFIKAWVTSAQNSATEINVKSATGRTANMMQEAWAYFNGKVGMSTKNYGTSILANGCQKNFIIFIGNSANAASGPADGGAESPYDGANALTSTQVGATTTQKAKITSSVTFTSSTCGATTRTAGSQASDWSSNWADEWARLLYQNDGGASGNFGKQNVITYTIGVVDELKNCSSDYPALLSSMARYGGGKFFKATSAADLKSALDTILNEVQAVDSVFSSASLPVSVNAQGTYLNQIYLGMFRPDNRGTPRWMGNLKQYRLARIGGDLVLADSTTDSTGQPNPAISTAGTGFLSPSAVSYWTYKDTTVAPDSLGGMFVQEPKGTPESGYDRPDGEVVEKGGSAQQLRKTNLTSTFTGASNTTANPRRVYTYCPSGTSCNSDLTDATNDFATTNSAITTSAFGSSTTVKISSIVRTGTTALVTTSGAHGFTTGNKVTISNATPTDYNVTQNVTVNSSTTFTITGLGDFPTTPTQGTYFITTGGTPVSISSITRTTNASGGGATETVTVTTSAPHGFTTSSNVVVGGASPSNYNFTGNPLTASGSTFTYNVSITPTTPAANTYAMALSASAYASQSNVSLTNPSQANITATTNTAHNLHVGQSITFSNSGNNKYDGTYTVTSVTTATSFAATMTSNGSNSLKNQGNTTGTLSVDTSGQAITSLTRAGTTTSTTATATGLPTNFFGSNVNDTATITVTKSSGNAANESAYLVSNVTATCQNSGCTTVTFPITVTPASTVTLTNATASLQGSKSASVAAGAITRSGATATISGVGSTFSSGDVVNITATGTSYADETAYLGTWTLTCSGSSCKFGDVAQTPSTPAAGAYMQAFSPDVGPERDSVIKWVRGADNFGDELGPCFGVASGCAVTARPSIHGDVLHSRPLVVNYGGTSGIVVFYGSNDGIFHAVNGNQTGDISGAAPGGELWGFVMKEHYPYLNRLRVNSPELKFPTTTLTTATAKDYFVDGPTGAFQKLNADGSINKAYIYLTMRRGGRFIYALDVTSPAAPKLLWKIDSSVDGFAELGQTWSRPRFTLLQSSTYKTTPVLIFGGGYDAAEDSEPPGTDAQGRGIFIVNAETGALIWSATPTCTTSATCLQVPNMKYAIPADITFVDRDNDGYTDKLYFGDLGGNVWRADVSATNSTSWTVTRVAALGCDTGACSPGTTPRKFFFPPAVLSVGASGATGSYDAVSIVSGDREHPLKNDATGSAYNTSDKFFMIKDQTTTVTPSSFITTDVAMMPTATGLFNATSTTWDGSVNGFYITFAAGEKGVNAPLALNGNIFFSTNQPKTPEATCEANLGTARAYAVSPFTSESSKNTLAGGGLPPSPVAGLVEVTTVGANNQSTTTEEKFCIGCGLATPPGSNSQGPSTCSGNAALQNCTPLTNVTGNLRRTYWYKK
jgi:Tfp pilus tip-associated adhesin PilY1